VLPDTAPATKLAVHRANTVLRCRRSSARVASCCPSTAREPPALCLALSTSVPYRLSADRPVVACPPAVACPATIRAPSHTNAADTVVVVHPTVGAQAVVAHAASGPDVCPWHADVGIAQGSTAEAPLCHPP
jgi:hypothetical protein